VRTTKHIRISRVSHPLVKKPILSTSPFQALSRVLEAARKSSVRPPNVPSAEQHAARLNELDVARISLAKAIRDAENSLAGKEAELAALKEKVREFEESDPAHDHQRDIDGTT